MTDPLTGQNNVAQRVNPDAADLIATAHAMADAARAAILPFFRNSTLRTDDKGIGRFDPVTEADRAAEAAMRAVLAVHRPMTRFWARKRPRNPAPAG